MCSSDLGRLYNVVSPRILVGLGVIFFSVGAWQMSHFTLMTGSWQIFSALVWQGFGFSLLFVPLTTVALSRIPRARLTDATGLNSLLRQIGGSIGLAIFASLIPRFTTTAMYGMTAHMVAGRPEVDQRLGLMTQLLMRQGASARDASRESIRLLWGLTMRQATVLTFEKLFMLSGILFVLVMPLLIFLRSPEHEKRAAAEHVHVEI